MYLTPKERVVKALLGEKVDKVPFTVYETFLPRCAVERKLRNMGLCVVSRNVPVLQVLTPDVKVKETRYQEGGKHYL
ncbi:MAG: hypothetical protein GXO71_06965, partial [Caldiserica bacterium]|nr:hypothetical protein [Caldisericota bacterium]